MAGITQNKQTLYFHCGPQKNLDNKKSKKGVRNSQQNLTLLTMTLNSKHRTKNKNEKPKIQKHEKTKHTKTKTQFSNRIGTKCRLIEAHQGLFQKFRVAFDISQKGHFLPKKCPENVNLPYSIPFLSVFHQNKGFHNFCKK